MMFTKIRIKPFIFSLVSIANSIGCSSNGTTKPTPSPEKKANVTTSGQSRDASNTQTKNALNLAKTSWVRCVLGDQVDNKSIYYQMKMTIDSENKTEENKTFQGSLSVEFHASDKNCRTKLTIAQILNSPRDWRVPDNDPALGNMKAREEMKPVPMTLLISAAPVDKDLYELDLRVKNDTSYHFVKISSDTLGISGTCLEEEVKEGKCGKISGDNPDNRSKSFSSDEVWSISK